MPVHIAVISQLVLAMTNWPKIALLFLFLVSVSTTSVNAQFINIELVIEPELSATVVNDLDFGNLIINSGEQFIELGDPSMGIFSIKGFKNQRVYLDIDFPEELIHLNPAIEDAIPISLSLAANNSGVEDYRNSFPIEGNNAIVAMHEYESIESYRNNKEVWETLYVYVFGSITIGNVSNGTYEGDIFLSVEYD